MASDQQHGGSGHYSGLNRIPNIKEFVAGLDRDKKERDAKIDNESKSNKNNKGITGVTEHTNSVESYKGKGRVVTDPVTGNQVTIDDVNADFMDAAKNPSVSELNPLKN